MELVAPAGGAERLRCAVHFGADAVYLALPRWGMRARADNFDLASLAEGVAWAHERGARIHLAVNTLMTDADLDELERELPAIAGTGVDAIIAADLGTLEVVRSVTPELELHLSTQASVMNARAAAAYGRLGVRRIVLAREMTLEGIAGLRRLMPAEIELEAFVHGSMCMAYSGRCLLSSELMGSHRSASAGACVQPCRWGWSLVEERDPARPIPVEADTHGSYLLSSNDLCMIEHLAELEEAGVAAAKIEGRSKGSYYTACVVNAYRHVLDGDAVAPWREELEYVSHRPYSQGFYFGSPEQNPGRVGYTRDRRMVAIVSDCVREDANEGDGWVAGVLCRNRASAGEEAYVLSPGEGIRPLTLPTDLTRTMERYEIRVPFPLEPCDIICVRRDNG